MAAIEFTGKEIYSRVLQAVPNVSENYVLNLINEALIDMGMHQQKMENAKTDLKHNQLWYALDDDESVTINKVFRCVIENSDGEYIMIPRLTPGQIKQFYNEASADTKTNTAWTEV
jgi:hypothetical protein|tara:strand:+ start:758 stop:1105 length:348 start_codon:yes stop_codon:yes gene_type:complete